MNIGIHGLKLRIVKELVYSTDGTKINRMIFHSFHHVTARGNRCDGMQQSCDGWSFYLGNSIFVVMDGGKRWDEWSKTGDGIYVCSLCLLGSFSLGPRK